MTDPNKNKIVLKYTMKKNELLSVDSFAKSILAFARLQKSIAKDLGAPKMEVKITDLAIFTDDDGGVNYVVETLIIPKGTKIANLHYVENVSDKYGEPKT